MKVYNRKNLILVKLSALLIPQSTEAEIDCKQVCHNLSSISFSDNFSNAMYFQSIFYVFVSMCVAMCKYLFGNKYCLN